MVVLLPVGEIFTIRKVDEILLVKSFSQPLQVGYAPYSGIKEGYRFPFARFFIYPSAYFHTPTMFFIDIPVQVFTLLYMFLFKKCNQNGCDLYAAEGEDYCLQHIPDPDECTHRIIRMVRENNYLKDINASCISVENENFSGHIFNVCNFSEGSFKKVNFARCNMELSFFQFSRFEDCNFENTDIKYSVFAGSTFQNCTFTDSDILHTNFLGIQADHCSFNDSDLYYSNFTSSRLTDVSFIDCNLKKADFVDSRRERVSFKYSNYEEARFKQDTVI